MLYPATMLTVKGAYALLWQLSEKFERSVPGWQHSLLVWRTSALDDASKATVLANLCARHNANGLAARAVVYVQQLNHGAAPETRDLASRLEKKLRDKGYDIAADALPEQPVLAVRNVPLRDVRREHLFLSDLTDKSVSPLPSGIKTTLELSHALAAASSWWLHESEWAINRKIRVFGKAGDAYARVRVAPPTSSMSSEISVQTSPLWNGLGRRPRWTKAARALLARQLRAGELSVSRTLSDSSLVFASRDVPRSAARVMRIARELGDLLLGDEEGAS